MFSASPLYELATIVAKSLSSEFLPELYFASGTAYPGGFRLGAADGSHLYVGNVQHALPTDRSESYIDAGFAQSVLDNVYTMLPESAAPVFSVFAYNETGSDYPQTFIGYRIRLN